MTKLPMTKEELLDLAVALVEASQTDLSNPGICLACGQIDNHCEPDARKYTCDFCEEKMVYGAQEVLIMFAV